jgi:hypothetical protein
MASQYKKPASMSKMITQILSPPVSPETKTDRHDVSVSTVNDPILYPSQDQLSRLSVERPLFAGDYEEAETQRAVDGHISARALVQHKLREASPPRRDDYILALHFKSQVIKNCERDRKRWMSREREYLLEDQRERNAYQKSQQRAIAPAPYPQKTTPPKIKRSAPAQRTPKVPAKVAHHQRAGSEVTKRNPALTTTREDKDFASLPDYSPALSTLPNKQHSLKADWKGTPIDLDNDPHRGLLHPDELHLAAGLRLDCATYLTSKRRIFIARIECMVKGKEFRKTDSQQACKIDVNKASKLWTAFDKVGWLDEYHFRKFV